MRTILSVAGVVFVIGLLLVMYLFEPAYTFTLVQVVLEWMETDENWRWAILIAFLSSLIIYLVFGHS